MLRTHDQYNAFDKGMRLLIVAALGIVVSFGIIGSALSRRTANSADRIVATTFESATSGRANGGGALELQRWLAGRRVSKFSIADKTVQFWGQSMILKVDVRLESGISAVIEMKCNSRTCWGISVRE